MGYKADTAESKTAVEASAVAPVMASKQLRSASIATQAEAVGLAADAQPRAVPVAVLFAAAFVPALAAGAMLVRLSRRPSDEAGLCAPLQADAKEDVEPSFA